MNSANNNAVCFTPLFAGIHPIEDQRTQPPIHPADSVIASVSKGH